MARRPAGGTLPAAQARRIALAAQGLASARPARRAGDGRVAALVDRLGALQLDAINVVARTQHLVVFSRLGPHDTAAVTRLSGPNGPLWEYWGHAASLLPVDLHPALRWRMEHGGSYQPGPTVRARIERWLAANRAYIDAVLAEVAERGPLTAGQLSDPRRKEGEWWDRRSHGREALEWLFGTGQLSAWRNPSFERVYDVPERVIRPDALAAPTLPVDEAHRVLLSRAAQAIGIGTDADLANHFMLKVSACRPRIAELVEAGLLEPVSVDGWAATAYRWAGAGTSPSAARRGATLLSPFDSVVWDRARAARLFGFDYRIEVYVPAPKRRYGYFVMPVLVGDRLVGRLDLKADRAASTLRILAAHAEPGCADDRPAAVSIAGELRQLATWLGLGDVAVADRGDLAPTLARAVKAS